eukprot:TRINITY_DN520_c1_g1_i2.p1 TRINITY_DN520_c1_g1~~TRINITY_DN520_c1_g1_i2.p1  ORF type:complete len:377 (-),score=72.07 TRINITY_DN520_c1_g1_i2:227-1357(-)
MAANVPSVYVHIIEDVVSKVRDDFISFGVGENVISELQGIWEMKMMRCGAIRGPIERISLPKAAGGPITPVHDLNVPYEGTEEYETPTAEMLFPPTPLQTPSQTPLPGTVEHSIYPLPTTPGDFATVHDARDISEVKTGRPSPYVQPPPSPWMNQRPLGVDVNVAYEERWDEVGRGTPRQPTTQDFFLMSSSKRKREGYTSHFDQGGGYMPQQDGAGDAPLGFFQPEVGQDKNSSRLGQVAVLSMRDLSAAPRIPQQDGIHDGYDDLLQLQGVTNEDYNAPADYDLQSPHIIGTPKSDNNEAEDDDEPPLNEDDDDDDFGDLEQEEEEPDTNHLVLAQFDKVTRTKSRWRCMLKDGIMRLNSKDILFSKATGDFDF